MLGTMDSKYADYVICFLAQKCSKKYAYNITTYTHSHWCIAEVEKKILKKLTVIRKSYKKIKRK